MPAVHPIVYSLAVRTPPVREGEIVEVVPEKLVAGGDALTRIDGFPIFVRGLFPDDRATVRLIELKKGFARGELVELMAPGSLRRVSPCPIAETCGGCDWTPLRLDHQLDAKKAILAETLNRVAKLQPADIPPISVHVSPLNYRIRSRLQIDHQKKSVGFFALRSHEVVDVVAECEVLGPLTIRHLDEVKAIALDSAEGEISVFEEGETLHVEAHGERRGAQPIAIEVRDQRYALSTASFFQVNRHLLGVLIDEVRKSAERCRQRETAFDLYGGVGFFAAPLANLFERVVSVEASPSSHPYAMQNGRKNIDARQEDVERFLERVHERPDFTMIDPPRAGAAPGVIEAIARMTRERICYLSCDPVTFARDVARLWRRGWRFESLAVVDLFPNTHHIETLSSFILERR